MNLDGLNKEQRRAVEETEGALLVLAGAGSGKTRVLTHKIAHLIEDKNIFPSNILAITFTNKAAKEMNERIDALIGGKALGLWMGTFHSMCLRVLRRNAPVIGYKSDFTIYDTSDQKTVIKNSLKALNIDPKQMTPKHVLNIISSAKNELVTPEKFEEINGGDFKYKNYINLYKMYQRTLRENNSMDFDDLINNTIKIFQENMDILEYYQEKFKYILIDEYQDTNFSQYLFASLLAGKHGNICAVGDGDQSIYKFRGADIRNIHEFEKDFNNAQIIKLEQNYRSTQNILDAANGVIKNNRTRKPKNLWTDNDKGDLIKYYEAYTEKDEAEYVFEKIKQYKKDSYDEFAILYRTNAQSRNFEDVFRKNNIPHQILGGLKFYERKEIKDILGYLRLIQNPVDDISFVRVVNEPKRSIGNSSVEKLNDFAMERGVSLYEALLDIERCMTLPARAKKSLIGFRKIIKEARANLDTKNALEIMEDIISKSGYVEDLKLKGTIQDTSRIENIMELKSGVMDFIKSNSDDQTLSNYLAETTLMTTVDTMDDNEPGVLMLTVHSAKGLEFKNVFVVGMEENIFPSFMSAQNDEDIEEERRLCYVAITRAEEQLFITNSMQRMLFGKTGRNMPSRFLDEIPSALIGLDNKYGDRKVISSTSNAISSTSDEFKPGVKVKHKAFGNGTVITVSAEGIIKIAFEGKGIKSLMVGMAPLEVIE